MLELRSGPGRGRLRSLRPRFGSCGIFASQQTTESALRFPARRYRIRRGKRGRYPALDLDGILIFIGVLFFLTLGVAIWVERRALRHAEVEALKRVYYGLIPIPWLLALLLLANGALDHSPSQIETTRVVGKFAMRGPVPSRRLIVSSWREDRRFERVPVDPGDFDRFAVGDTVGVHVKGGLVGIPWVSGVSRP